MPAFRHCWVMVSSLARLGPLFAGCSLLDSSPPSSNSPFLLSEFWSGTLLGSALLLVVPSMSNSDNCFHLGLRLQAPASSRRSALPPACHLGLPSPVSGSALLPSGLLRAALLVAFLHSRTSMEAQLLWRERPLPADWRVSSVSFSNFFTWDFSNSNCKRMPPHIWIRVRKQRDTDNCYMPCLHQLFLKYYNT